MKKVEAIVGSNGVSSLLKALDDAGCYELTVYNVQARTRKPPLQVWRGMRFFADMAATKKLEVLVDDEALIDVLSIIRAHPSLGAAGKHRIAVFSLEEQLSDYVEEHILAAVAGDESQR